MPLHKTAIYWQAVMQSPKGWSYKDLAEDSNASLASGSQMQPTHSNFSAVSRATSVATSLISRTHSTFLQGHKKFGLKRKSLWDKVLHCIMTRSTACKLLSIILSLHAAAQHCFYGCVHKNRPPLPSWYQADSPNSQAGCRLHASAFSPKANHTRTLLLAAKTQIC